VTDDQTRAPIELRTATATNVDFAHRLITVIAVPYEQPAEVPYRGETWKEVFERGSFDGIEKRPNRVRSNRDHDRSRTVGKVVRFHPNRDEGLVAEVRIGQTPLGDETLQLASEDMLSASIGFGVRNSDQVLDRSARERRIRRAYLDHLSFVESPAYDGARVLSVRDGVDSADIALSPIPATPGLDQFISDDILRWAAERFK
jgi:HK97 family phage prohead protease